MSTFYAFISRMRDIRRWGLMRNTFEENIQGHSHMAAVLAHALALIGNTYFGRAYDPDKVAAAALFHDAPEILTGDLPTPVKYHNPAIREAYRGVESVAQEKLLATLPDGLREAYRPLLFQEELPGEVQALVRAADKLAALIKCVEEGRGGNSEFHSAAKQIHQALEASPLPEVGWFLEYCLPAFERTLDEL